jgi:hypothetical protein
MTEIIETARLSIEPRADGEGRSCLRFTAIGLDFVFC